MAGRVDVVLVTAEGEITVELMRRTGISKPTVWRWQERYLDEGVPALKGDKTRTSRAPPLPGEVRLKIDARTVQETLANATHTAAARRWQRRWEFLRQASGAYEPMPG